MNIGMTAHGATRTSVAATKASAPADTSLRVAGSIAVVGATGTAAMVGKNLLQNWQGISTLDTKLALTFLGFAAVATAGVALGAIWNS